MFIMALMMIPGCLTLTPQFTLIQDLGLKNSWFALWLPWVAGGQVFGIILCRTFMSAIPTEIFESARIDGCGELRALFTIAIPLSKPILATLAINNMIGFYNDFIWPTMVIESNSKQVIMVAVRVFQSATGTMNVGCNGCWICHCNDSAADPVPVRFPSVHRGVNLRRCKGVKRFL